MTRSLGALAAVAALGGSVVQVGTPVERVLFDDDEHYEARQARASAEYRRIKSARLERDAAERARGEIAMAAAAAKRAKRRTRNERIAGVAT